jgi:hypothetical protein
MSHQPEKLEFVLRSSIFDRPRQLVLDSQYLEFDDNDRASSAPTRFLKEEIEGVRFGVKWIRGYDFYIGRIYCIDVKNISGQIIKLRLKSIYGVRKRQLGDKYTKIANTIFRYYFDPISLRYIKLFQNGQPFEILGVSIDPEGVLFDYKAGRVSWDFLGTKRYQTYYTLFSEANPTEYKAYEYINHWNAGVLQSVVEGILKIKFPKRK